MPSRPDTDPHVHCSSLPNHSQSLQLSLGVKEAARDQQPPSVLNHLLRARTSVCETTPPSLAGLRPQRSATLQKTGILTSEPFPALGQPVCANGFSHSHCGHGKGPTLLCAGVERWDAIYQGRRDLRHRKMRMRNWETRETKVRKIKSKGKERTRAHP